MENPRQTDREMLFLMEVLVDYINISHSSLNLNRSVATNLTDTCVMFQFLHYPPLVVCESDFLGYPTNQMNTNHLTFQSGKSCFFSLRVPKGPVLPTPLEIKVSIIYKMKENVLPDKLEIGNTSIDMGNSFTQLLNSNTDEDCDKLPLSKSVTGTYDIKDEAGKTVGSLSAFVRLSCFGKLIITQFSFNKDDEKSYLFKGTDVKQICKETRDGKPPFSSKTGNGDEVELMRSKGSMLGQNKQFDRYESNQYGYGHNKKIEETPFCGVGNLGKPPFPSKTGHGFEVDLIPPKGNIQGQNRQFDRYETNPCGYEPQCPFSQPSSPCRFGASPQYQQYPNNPCEFPCPRPQTSMSKKPCQRTDVNMCLEPGEVGLQEDQVIFQLPLKRQGEQTTSRDKESDSTIFYKLTSAEEACGGLQTNSVQIKSDDLPGMAGGKAATLGPVSGLPVDDGHDVFHLKIGKKCDGDKRRNLELELRTPKMKEPKPPMTDQNTQYLESDIPKMDGGGKKEGKGKKGSKAGKGKKGKK